MLDVICDSPENCTAGEPVVNGNGKLIESVLSNVFLFRRQVCFTGGARLIRSHSSARISFQLSGNSN